MRAIPLARIGAYPLLPPGTVGWYAHYCAFEALSPYHPERMTVAQRARYEADAGEPAPPRNPYRVDRCCPARLGQPATKETEDPWLAYPGARISERCLAWLRAEFAPRPRRG
jgi:hypothetical protein